MDKCNLILGIEKGQKNAEKLKIIQLYRNN